MLSFLSTFTITVALLYLIQFPEFLPTLEHHQGRIEFQCPEFDTGSNNRRIKFLHKFRWERLARWYSIQILPEVVYSWKRHFINRRFPFLDIVRRSRICAFQAIKQCSEDRRNELLLRFLGLLIASLNRRERGVPTNFRPPP